MGGSLESKSPTMVYNAAKTQRLKDIDLGLVAGLNVHASFLCSMSLVVPASSSFCLPATQASPEAGHKGGLVQ